MPHGPPWIGTWACGPQPVEPGNLPPAPGLTGNTLRQVVHVSVGGRRLRVRFSNAYGDGPVTMSAVHLAASAGGGAIDPTSDRSLAFDGKPFVTIPPGQTVVSDPIDFALHPLTKVAVTIAFGTTPAAVTGHPGSRTTSFLQVGDAVAATDLPAAVPTDHWYVLTGIDVVGDAASAAVVALGDSLTDGRGSTTNGNNRWPDNLARRLQASPATAGVAVLNLGIGGNAVLSGGLGPPAVERFERDVLGQTGVRWLIVLAGVNDIGLSKGPGVSAVAADLVAAFGRFIDRAHARGIRVYGVPILPFGGSQYDSAEHETARQTVNHWILTSGRFDAVIDLDAVVRDPARPARLLPAYDDGDHLHLNVAGYQAISDGIDLALFAIPAGRGERPGPSGRSGPPGRPGRSRRSGLATPPGTADVLRPAGPPGHLTVLPWAGFKSAVTYTFDDANSSQIDHYADLQALGVPMTFYLITGKPEAHNGVWAEAVRDGHELGNHSMTHVRAGTAADLEAANDFIKETLGVDVWTMASPFGDPSYPPLAASRFMANRGVANGSIAPNDDTDPFNLPCYVPPRSAPAAAFNAQIDAARSAGRWKVVLVHGFTGGTDAAYQPVDIAQFTASVAHAKSFGDIWIDSLVNVASYWRGGKLLSSLTPASGQTTTWTWVLPAHFPPGKFLRVKVDGGTLRQRGEPLAWDGHGYYEVALDAGSLTLGP